MALRSDIREGVCCAWCDAYFEQGHGQLTLCHKDWKHLQTAIKKGEISKNAAQYFKKAAHKER